MGKRGGYSKTAGEIGRITVIGRSTNSRGEAEDVLFQDGIGSLRCEITYGPL